MINALLFAVISPQIWSADIWYSLPLIVAISLVYSATRNESMGAILNQAFRLGFWIAAFMILIFAILWFLSS